MEGSRTKQKRIAHINQKGISLETLIADTIVYLYDPACDPINVKLRLSTITRLFDEYSGLNDELATLKSDHPRLEALRVINTSYYELAAANAKLQTSNPIAHSTLNTSNITITERQDKPRLPEIKIPTFNGEQGKWVSWKHSFEGLIHSRTDITDYVKHSQLINALSGPALEKIIAFPPSEENYSIVWKSLCDTYDKRHFIILEHFDAILEIPDLTKTNPDELSVLVDKEKQHIRMLSDMKLEMNDYGEQMTLRILEKASPPGVLRKWQERLNGIDLPKLTDFFEFIQLTAYRIQSFEQAALGGRSVAGKRAGEKINQPFSKMRKSSDARSLVTSASNNNPSTSKCPKCQEEHRLYKCPQFDKLKISDRWNFVKSQKICRNCLGAHTLACKSNRKCKKCDRDHHTLLHNDKPRKPEKTVKPESLRKEDAKLSNTAAPQAWLEGRSYVSEAFPSDSQLMTTAVLKVKNSRGNDFMARALLDSCSTVNLITEQFAKSLNLAKQTCSINIGAVNGLCAASNEYLKATFQSIYNDLKRELKFLIVPKIADLVPNEIFPRNRFVDSRKYYVIYFSSRTDSIRTSRITNRFTKNHVSLDHSRRVRFSGKFNKSFLQYHQVRQNS